MGTHRTNNHLVKADPDVRRICALRHGPIYKDEPDLYRCPDCCDVVKTLTEVHTMPTPEQLPMALRIKVSS